MAKRHPADEELTAALSILAEIDAAVSRWLPGENMPSENAETVDVAETERADKVGVVEPSKSEEPNVAAVIAATNAADGVKSPHARLARRFDDDIHTIIAQASDTEIPSFQEKILRRFLPGRLPQDMRRRDGVLAARLVVSLERASRLIAALTAHRQIMQNHLSLIEADLVERIDAVKSADEGDSATVTTAEALAARQDVVEAIIRHEAACNSVYHKLSIEAERALIVLHALSGGQGISLADQLSGEAREALSPLLALSDKGMLSMREVDRRKSSVDDNFQHRFNPSAVRTDTNTITAEKNPLPQTLSA